MIMNYLNDSRMEGDGGPVIKGACVRCRRQKKQCERDEGSVSCRRCLALSVFCEPSAPRRSKKREREQPADGGTVAVKAPEEEEEEKEVVGWDYGHVGTVMNETSQTENAVLLLMAEHSLILRQTDFIVGALGLTTGVHLTAAWFAIRLPEDRSISPDAIDAHMRASALLYLSAEFSSLYVGLQPSQLVGLSPRVLNWGPGTCASMRELNRQRLTGLERGIKQWSQHAFFVRKNDGLRFDRRIDCFVFFAQSRARLMIVSVRSQDQVEEAVPDSNLFDFDAEHGFWSNMDDLDVDWGDAFQNLV